jgi:hypothetical protein
MLQHFMEIAKDFVTIGGATKLLKESVSYIVPFIVWLSVPRQDRDEESKRPENLHYNIDELLEKIKSGKLSRENPNLIATGTLFPALLLYPGWWDRRKDKTFTFDLAGCNDLQKWLFTGFEKWAPSWEISLEKKDNPYLLAQLAVDDEANSVPLIIPSEKTNEIRDYFLNHKAPLTVEVIGELCHRSDLSDDLLGDNLLSAAITDYCIIVRKDKIEHGVRILGKSTFYTGYLWQCWAPSGVIEMAKKESRSPRLNEVYFAWEHTNYGSSEALKYNLDGLEKKRRYIQKELSSRVNPIKLVLVQKSSILVPGRPEFPTRIFYESLLREGQTYK